MTANYRSERIQMVEDQLRARGIRDDRVLEAMARVPRHLFIPPEQREAAYQNGALPIGEGQTISQPWIVAATLQALRIAPTDRALDIGTGSGYQAALLAELAGEVVSVERLADLSERAGEAMDSLGYRNFTLVVGDGSKGYEAHAPYDVIAVAAGAGEIPPRLIEQLAEEGRMVIPVGGSRQVQMLTLVEKREGRIRKTPLCECVFVPFVGATGWPEVGESA
ncbi:MAG: protein-L-isoaspartate(D-aspartate) O-methyltransferase [Armatimonadetes bacterium]|nr:protein-L-isoaspartate(D-aspartate) O-methyltransferase [Armatimonadota bacterium]